MGANSKIEWTHHTFNPWIGCSKVHTGCQHCYAESLSKRTGKAVWGPSGTRVRTTNAYWRQPLKWDREAAEAGERRRVFCASLADVGEIWDGPILDSQGNQLWTLPGFEVLPLHDRYIAGCEPTNSLTGVTRRAVTMDDLRRDLFELIDSTQNIDWLLLTKRIENIPRMWPLPANGRDPGDVLYARRENVWLGTSVSSQETLGGVKHLVKCRDLAPVLFLSGEPLVGEISFRWQPFAHEATGETYREYLERQGSINEFESLRMIDWVIVGGESGHGSRPMHPDWARQIRDECLAAGVPFFFKQWGEFAPVPMTGKDEHGREHKDIPGPPAVPIKNVTKSVVLRRDGSKSDTMPGKHQPDAWWMVPVGKQDAGHLLDGVEWQFFPHAARSAQHGGQVVARGAAEIAEPVLRGDGQ